MKNVIKLSLIALMATNMTAMAVSPSSFSFMPNTTAVLQVGAPIDINHATAEQLQSLKGIGHRLAKAIVTYRTNTGTFKTVHDLTKVPRLSEKLLEKILKKNGNRLICKQ